MFEGAERGLVWRVLLVRLVTVIEGSWLVNKRIVGVVR